MQAANLLVTSFFATSQACTSSGKVVIKIRCVGEGVLEIGSIRPNVTSRPYESQLVGPIVGVVFAQVGVGKNKINYQ